MENLIIYFSDHIILAILVSVTANVLIAVLGVLPSIFVTSFNILVFGYINGFFVSVLGESLGASISFIVYRQGLQKISQKILEKNKKIKKIITSENKETIKLVILMRLFPYIPSGLVTYGASMSNLSIISFTIASTIGKVPALILEVIVSGMFINMVNVKSIDIILALVCGMLIYKTIKGILRRNDE